MENGLRLSTSCCLIFGKRMKDMKDKDVCISEGKNAAIFLTQIAVLLNAAPLHVG
jgi:hypothetical protein